MKKIPLVCLLALPVVVLFPCLTLGQNLSLGNTDMRGLGGPDDVNFFGPNPFADIRQNGAVASNPSAVPSIPGLSGTISANSTALSLSSAWTLGDNAGIVIRGGGAPASNCSTAPSAPALSVISMSGGPGTLYTAFGPTGSNGYFYKIVGKGANGCRTPASSEVSIRTGMATLGSGTPYTISNISRSNNLTTVTLSGGHTIPTNTCSSGTCPYVYISGVTSGQGSFIGWFPVYSVPNSTSVVIETGYDTRFGAETAGYGGTLTLYPGILLTLPNPPTETGTTIVEYLIYEGTSSGSETLIGVSNILNPTLSSTGYYYTDYGSKYWSNAKFRDDYPSTPQSSASAGDLVTTVCSGTGTTSLTLCSAASTSVSSGTVLLDNSLALYNTAHNASLNGGCAVIPNTAQGYAFVVNAFTNFPNTWRPTFCQLGELYLNETLAFNLGPRWFGEAFASSANLSCPQFGIACHPQVVVNSANPGVVSLNTTMRMDGLALTAASGINAYELMDISGGAIPTAQLTNMAFVGSGSSNDTSGLGLYAEAQALAGGAAGINMEHVAFDPFIEGGTNFTQAPFVVFKQFGEIYSRNNCMAGRGIFVQANSAGVQFEFKQECEIQGPAQPLITLAVPNGTSGFVHIHNSILDSAAAPTVENIIPGYFTLKTEDMGQNGVIVQGAPIFSVITNGQLGTSPPAILYGQNTDTEVNEFGQMYDANLGNHYAAWKLLPGATGINRWPFFTVQNPMAAPTCKVKSGGSMSAATWTVEIAPNFANGDVGQFSSPSPSCTTTSGKQSITVSWTALNDPIGYSVYFSTGGSYSTGVFVSGGTTNSVTLTSNPNSASYPYLPTSGPAGIQNGFSWADIFRVSPLSSYPTPPSGFAGTQFGQVIGDSEPSFTFGTSTMRYLIPNGKNVGICTFSSSTTCSVTFSSFNLTFNSTPIILLTPVNNKLNLGFWVTSPSKTGFIITASSSNSLSVNWMAIGNPN